MSVSIFTDFEAPRYGFINHYCGQPKIRDASRSRLSFKAYGNYSLTPGARTKRQKQQLEDETEATTSIQRQERL